MDRKLINDRDLRYRVEKQNEYDKIHEILQEAAEEQEMIENAWLEGTEVLTEEVEANLINPHKEKMNKDALLNEEAENKLHDTARKLFSEIVLESIPLVKEKKNMLKDNILISASDVYDALFEANIINTSLNSAWGVLYEKMDLICRDSNKTIQECYVDIVNKEVDLLATITECVSKKIEDAIKLEQTFINLRESHQYISEKPSLLRCLIESEYKKLNEDNTENLANTALLEGAISYTIIETINTAKIVDGLNYDHVIENYRFLGR